MTTYSGLLPDYIGAGLAADRPVLPVGYNPSVAVSYFATDTGVLSEWDGTAWIDVGAGGGLPTGGTTGQVLTKDSSTDFDVSWQTPGGGGGGGATPAFRSAAIQSASNTNFNVAFPAGAAAEDLCLIFGAAAYMITNPTGWVELDNSVGSFTNGYTGARVLTAADIALGYVTVSTAGAYNAVFASVCFQGQGNTRPPVVAQRNSAGSLTVTIGSDGSPLTTDEAVYFGANRGASTNTVNLGTARASVNASEASGCVYSGAPAASGGVIPTFAYTVPGSGNYQVIVIVRGTY